jgi:hypothetical protein
MQDQRLLANIFQQHFATQQCTAVMRDPNALVEIANNGVARARPSSAVVLREPEYDRLEPRSRAGIGTRGSVSPAPDRGDRRLVEHTRRVRFGDRSRSNRTVRIHNHVQIDIALDTALTRVLWIDGIESDDRPSCLLRRPRVGLCRGAGRRLPPRRRLGTKQIFPAHAATAHDDLRRRRLRQPGFLALAVDRNRYERLPLNNVIDARAFLVVAADNDPVSLEFDRRAAIGHRL